MYTYSDEKTEVAPIKYTQFISTAGRGKDLFYSNTFLDSRGLPVPGPQGPAGPVGECISLSIFCLSVHIVCLWNISKIQPLN